MMETFENLNISVETQQVIGAELAWTYGVIPHKLDENSVGFLISEDAAIEEVKDDLEIILGKEILLTKIPKNELRRNLGKFYRRSGLNNKEQISGDELENDDLLLNIIFEARKLGSSDIHIEIYDGEARIRIRIDGHLIEKYKISSTDYPEIVNKIKIKSNLDITERRLPQDGRISFKDFDVRVSVLPTLYGEKIVLRILSRDSSGIDINNLGFEENELRDYLEGVRRPNGIILISGPTGSGKTTTLYATLKMLNDEKRNIMTVEDPIEYTLKGINQVQLKESIGLTFASTLRSFLRQDPDIIMLGEIRDSETAQMAIRAALTGHLVLSTIHTNSAWGTVSRLVDMGVPPFLLAGTLNASVAQRLVRILCPDCKEKQETQPGDLPKNFSEKTVRFHWVAKGCESCHYTGYRGRKAIYEVIHIDRELSKNIKEQEMDVETLLKEKGIEKLSEKSLRILLNGDTSLDEVYSLITNG